MAEAQNHSMLKKFKEFFVGRKSGEITPSEAEKIQKAAYEIAHTETKRQFTPVYYSLLPGLDSDEKQLFEASVYYLARIAANKNNYTKEIVEILKKKATDNKVNPEYREYIKQQLQNISQKNNF